MAPRPTLKPFGAAAGLPTAGTPLFQSAPNFSEGRNAETLAALREAARFPGVILADFSADADHNRCVTTLLGDAAGLEEAAFRMASVAVSRIDLAMHTGQHPRLGALDVLPFIPVRHAAMDDANILARRVGKRLAAELNLPVYLYAHSAATPERASLPSLRRGGFEGLAAKMAVLPPDFGPSVPHPTAGAVIVGAREALLAFNVSLNTLEVAVAKRIATRLRESGGGLRGVRALGLLVNGRAQVSVNIIDTDAVTLTDVFAAVSRLAAAEGIPIHSSELVGGITLAQTLRALNDTLSAHIQARQVLDAWLPPASFE